MKVSDLRKFLDSIPTDADPELVTGEVWLPERLLALHLINDQIFCEFDNAPEETEGEDEGRGFVEHEIELLRKYIMSVFLEKTSLENKQEALLALILFAHEQLPSNVVEMLSAALSPDDE